MTEDTTKAGEATAKEKMSHLPEIAGRVGGALLKSVFDNTPPQTTSLVDEEVKKWKNSKKLYWFILIGICIIALGAVVDGIGKIVVGVSSLINFF